MTRAAARIFVLLCLLLAVAGLGTRVAIALSAHDLLDWDETYYASTTATAAHGLGLYPYILGYPRIHNMGVSATSSCCSCSPTRLRALP